MNVESNPVLSASEMSRIEKISLKEGASEQEYVLKAGSGIAQTAWRILRKQALPRTVRLLVGKGNNGADALAAGIDLIKKGIRVTAYKMYPLEASGPLCRKYAEMFMEQGGELRFIQDSSSLTSKEPLEGLMIDGLFGTGLSGSLREKEQTVIQAVNALHGKSVILSIDIPSGVSGDTGTVNPVAVRATETVFLGALKIGGFIREGYEHIGHFSLLPFGLAPKYLDMAKKSAYLLEEEEIAHALPRICKVRHKYRAGYLLAVAGSKGMSGAAVLSSFSALRSGAGIVRLFYPSEMESEPKNAPWELIKTQYDQDPTPFIQELRRANAVMIGPGLGRSQKTKTFLEKIVSAINTPTIIDADALFLLQDLLPSLPFPAVLTPHRGEMLSLLGQTRFDDILAECAAFADTVGHVVVVKGAPTFLFRPHALPVIITRGDPGMATAGTGDVLSGVIAALLAQKTAPWEAALLGVYLHACAGERAAEKYTSYGMTASDLIEALPDVFKRLQVLKNFRPIG